MCCERLPSAVPEGIHKDLVVLDGNGADGSIKVKRASLEHDTVLIVHTGSFWEDQERRRVCSRHMSLHPFPNNFAVLHLRDR